MAFAGDEQIRQIILNSHFRNKKKIQHLVRKTYPMTNRQDIDRVLDTIEPKDKYHLKGTDTQTHYYHTIFTPYMGGWQVDLLVQSEYAQDHNHLASYFFVAVNVNTKYAWVSPIKGKTRGDFEKVLGLFIKGMKKLIEDNHVSGMTGGKEGVVQSPVVKIVADKEGGLEACKEWLKQTYHVDLQTVPSERHSTLGVVDRFIRTLRDMNAKQQDKTSDNQRVRDFTAAMMTRLVDEYNNSFHTSTGLTPREMQLNPDKQKEYIIKKVYEQNRREKISDYDLEIGSWVRFMIPRHFTKKRRFQVSPEIVQIVGREGKSYVVRAGGETKTFSRWRLFPVKDADTGKFKQAKTFGF
jgi:hypothetical protein